MHGQLNIKIYVTVPYNRVLFSILHFFFQPANRRFILELPSYIQRSDKVLDHSVPCTAFEVVNSILSPSQGQQMKGPQFSFNHYENDFTVAFSRAVRALSVTPYWRESVLGKTIRYTFSCNLSISLVWLVATQGLIVGLYAWFDECSDNRRYSVEGGHSAIQCIWSAWLLLKG